MSTTSSRKQLFRSSIYRPEAGKNILLNHSSKFEINEYAKIKKQIALALSVLGSLIG